MATDREIWCFASSRLLAGENVVLMVVATSTGSSPGRQGYKMAIGADGELMGSIGGGVMEVALVEQSRAVLSVPPAVAGGLTSTVYEKVHQKNAANASGMICSGKQMVIFRRLNSNDLSTVETIIKALKTRELASLTIAPDEFISRRSETKSPNDYEFEKKSDTDFVYTEKLGKKNDLYIVGGGHCALALSELMSRMDFHIAILDDRPELNTLENNKYADEIKIIDSYQQVGELIPAGHNIYVVVMTLEYTSDELVIRQLIDHDLKYFGVLGSRSKMKTLLTALEKGGIPKEKLDRIHTPIGLPINSHSPEEIAVSIAAEIISIKNAD